MNRNSATWATGLRYFFSMIYLIYIGNALEGLVSKKDQFVISVTNEEYKKRKNLIKGTVVARGSSSGYYIGETRADWINPNSQIDRSGFPCFVRIKTPENLNKKWAYEGEFRKFLNNFQKKLRGNTPKNCLNLIRGIRCQRGGAVDSRLILDDFVKK